MLKAHNKRETNLF
jgi:hypothetical protein